MEEKATKGAAATPTNTRIETHLGGRKLIMQDKYKRASAVASMLASE
jgi:hypothetical protein